MILAGPPGPLIDTICAAATGSGVTVVHVEAGAAIPQGEALLASVMVPALGDRAADGGMVIALDDAGASLARLRRLGFGLVDAVRHLTRCSAVLGPLAAQGTPVVTRAGLFNVSGLLSRLGLPDMPPPAIAAGGAPLDPQDQALLDAVLPQGFEPAGRGQRSDTAWPLACLFNGDRPGEPAPRVIDLAGPARVLAYGPYFHLAPGAWRARARLRFRADCAGAPFALELHGAARAGRCRFRCAEAGLFAAEFGATIGDPDEPLEIRLVLERGAIEGALSLVDVALGPVDSL